MTGYDYERPYISTDQLTLYRATDPVLAQRYGKHVKATEMSNVEYKQRFERLSAKQSMKAPPSTGRIFPGYLVIRHLDRADAYETWIPDMGFEDSYEPIASSKLEQRPAAPAPTMPPNSVDLDDFLSRLDLSAIAEPGDKVRECEYFLGLAGIETNRERFRWLITAYLNAVYSFFETSALYANASFTDPETGDPIPDDEALRRIRSYVRVFTDAKKPFYVKTGKLGGTMKRLYEIRSAATHHFPLSIMEAGPNLPEDFHLGNMRGEGAPVLALCREALEVVKAAQRDLDS